jgi:hypothetical protein
MTTQSKLPPTLTGIAGEYFVAAELSRRGFMASITLRNNDSVDIHASNLETGKMFAIQVKTTFSDRASWILNQKAEKNHKTNHYYVFVNLGSQLERPKYYIVPSKAVADFVSKNHAKWLKTPGKKRQKHNDNSVRKFSDTEGKYLEKWDLLD